MYFEYFTDFIADGYAWILFNNKQVNFKWFDIQVVFPFKIQVIPAFSQFQA